MCMMQRHFPGTQRRRDPVVGRVSGDGLTAANEVFLAGIVVMIGEAALMAARNHPNAARQLRRFRQRHPCRYLLGRIEMEIGVVLMPLGEGRSMRFLGL